MARKRVMAMLGVALLTAFSTFTVHASGRDVASTFAGGLAGDCADENGWFHSDSGVCEVEAP